MQYLSRWVAARFVVPTLVGLSVAAFLTKAAWSDVVFQISNDVFTTPAEAVFVASALNGWSPSALPMSLNGTTWSAMVALPDGQHEYKFAWTDSRGQTHWMNDPANPYLIDDGLNGANSLIEVRAGVRITPTWPFERFEWDAPAAKWVCVAGDFNKWYLGQFQMVKLSGDTWVAHLPVRRPFAYKFIVDGLWKCDLDSRAPRIPNALGGFNSFRAAAELTTPSAVTITRTVVAGDTRELDIVTSYVASGDYGRAVALARKVTEVNAAASGSTSPLVLRALDLEGQAHKRWNRLDDAAACWKRLAEANVETPETWRGVVELASYYLHVKRDSDLGRQLTETAIARAPDNVELILAITHLLNLNLREGHVDYTIATCEKLLALLPPPEGESKRYACELSEIWGIKGAAHSRLKQLDKARQAFEKVIAVHPYSDSQNVQRARLWLERNGFAVTAKP